MPGIFTYSKVGEPFAEQPYAVAVQQVFPFSNIFICHLPGHQGSHLSEEISRVVLELQKDRYFETLYSR